MTQVFVSMGFFPDDYFAGTVDYIAKLQDADGAIPWFDGGPMDPWDHIESAMGLTIGGHFDQAKAAFHWLKNNQLPNGSWLAAYKDGKVEDGTPRGIKLRRLYCNRSLALLSRDRRRRVSF